MVFCLRRLPGLSPAAFSDYWRDRHAELFRTYAQALNVTRYTQTHTLDLALNDAVRAGRGAPAAYDGVAQVWFPGLEELLAGVTGAEGRAAGAALIEDEKNFIDHANSPIWIGEQIDVIG